MDAFEDAIRTTASTGALFVVPADNKWFTLLVVAAAIRPLHSTLGYLQAHADFGAFIVGELNTGLFKGFLYLKDCGEVSFHDPFVLLDPLKCRQADPRGAGELTLAPAKECPRRSYLRRIPHRFSVFSIRFELTTTPLLDIFNPITD